MRGSSVRLVASALALSVSACATVDRRTVMVVDVATGDPATIWFYGGERVADPDIVPENESYIAIAAWSDGRLVCRGYGFEGELGRTTVDPSVVARAAEVIASAIELVPDELRIAGDTTTARLVCAVSRDGHVLRFSPYDIHACPSIEDACKATDSAFEMLLPEHCRRSNPPAPDFDLLDPASVRFERMDPRVER